MRPICAGVKFSICDENKCVLDILILFFRKETQKFWGDLRASVFESNQWCSHRWLRCREQKKSLRETIPKNLQSLRLLFCVWCSDRGQLDKTWQMFPWLHTTEHCLDFSTCSRKCRGYSGILILIIYMENYARLIGRKRVHFLYNTGCKVVTWVQITNSARAAKISSVLTFCDALSCKLLTCKKMISPATWCK